MEEESNEFNPSARFTSSSRESSLSANPSWASLLPPHSQSRLLSETPAGARAFCSCSSLPSSNHKAGSSARCSHPTRGCSWDLVELGDIHSQDGGERGVREGRVKGLAAGEGSLQTPSPALGGLHHSIPLQISYTQLSPSPPPVPLGLGGKGSPACSLHTAHGEQRLQPTPLRQLLSVRQEHRSAGSWQRCP